MLCFDPDASGRARRPVAFAAVARSLKMILVLTSVGVLPALSALAQDSNAVSPDPPKSLPPESDTSIVYPKAAPMVQKPAPVAYYKTVKRGIPLHVVQADLNSPSLRVTVATAGNGIGTRDRWSSMIYRTHPTAAITGTYFDPRTAVPVGTIVVGGQFVHQGYVGSAFVFSPPNAAILPAAVDTLQQFETVLRAGPRLLVNGKVLIEPWKEGFRDPAIYARKRRAVVGITRHNKLVFVAVDRPVHLRPLAHALRDLGVVDALCMDGGSSAGLYHRGKTRVLPKRSLTNLLLIYDTPERYARYADRLTPNGPKVVITAEGAVSM